MSILPWEKNYFLCLVGPDKLAYIDKDRKYLNIKHLNRDELEESKNRDELEDTK